MSVESFAIALNHSRARGAAKLVLIGIANHDGDGGSWPSIATLARYAGVTPRQAQRLVGELERLGEIRRHRNAGGTARTAEHLRPNLYEFRLACPMGCDRTKQHRVKGEGLALDLLTDPELLTGVTPTSPPDTGVTPPLTPTSPEPSLNRTTDDQRQTQVIAGAREERPADPELYTYETRMHCSLANRRGTGRHRDAGSGYCLHCGVLMPTPPTKETR